MVWHADAGGGAAYDSKQQPLKFVKNFEYHVLFKNNDTKKELFKYVKSVFIWSRELFEII